MNMGAEMYSQTLMDLTKDMVSEKIFYLFRETLRRHQPNREEFLEKAPTLFANAIATFSGENQYETFGECVCEMDNMPCCRCLYTNKEITISDIRMQSEIEFHYMDLNCEREDIFVPYADVEACVNSVTGNPHSAFYLQIVDRCFEFAMKNSCPRASY